jgi:hypothetical protein
MENKSEEIAWVQNMIHKFEAMFLEVDEIMGQVLFFISIFKLFKTLHYVWWLIFRILLNENGLFIVLPENLNLNNLQALFYSNVY